MFVSPIVKGLIGVGVSVSAVAVTAISLPTSKSGIPDSTTTSFETNGRSVRVTTTGGAKIEGDVVVEGVARESYAEYSDCDSLRPETYDTQEANTKYSNCLIEVSKRKK